MKLKREGTRFVKFLIVGTVGAVVDLGIFTLLTALFLINANIAQAFSFIAAVINNFVWNRFWTYPDSRSKPLAWQLGQFTLINAVGLFIRTPLFIYLTPVWNSALAPLPFELPFSKLKAAQYLALGCVMVVVMIWNFAINRLWTYNDVS